MIKQTRPALLEAQQRHLELADVELRLPTMLIEREATLRLGHSTLILHHSPGHAPDVITVYVKEEKVLFASDTVMPVPYFVNGNIADMRRSLLTIKQMAPVEDIVQGHGEVLLRGEVDSVLEAQLAYLDCLEQHVNRILAQGGGRAELDAVSLEDCGLSRIALNGYGLQLHRANLYFLYGQARKQAAKTPA
jgi:glyoxylase-like metal-dependent hydrolase (beta-lactamase superfamily II)